MHLMMLTPTRRTRDVFGKDLMHPERTGNYPHLPGFQHPDESHYPIGRRAQQKRRRNEEQVSDAM